MEVNSHVLSIWAFRAFLLLSFFGACKSSLQAQDIIVEWAEFRGTSDTSYVFNAYKNPSDGSIAGWYYSLYEPTPLQQQQAQSFIETLGFTSTTDISTARTADPWGAVVNRFTQVAKWQTEAGTIQFRELSDKLNKAYIDRGLPSPQNPIFTHLRDGFLVVLDPNEDVVSIPYELDYGEVGVGGYQFSFVTVANFGREPVELRLRNSLLRPAEFRGADMTLGPGERRTLMITFEPSLLSTFLPAPRASVSYTTRTENGTALHLRATPVRSLSQFLNGVTATVISPARSDVIYRTALIITVCGLTILFFWVVLPVTSQWIRNRPHRALVITTSFKRVKNLRLRKETVPSHPSESRIEVPDLPVQRPRYLKSIFESAIPVGRKVGSLNTTLLRHYKQLREKHESPVFTDAEHLSIIRKLRESSDNSETLVPTGIDPKRVRLALKTLSTELQRVVKDRDIPQYEDFEVLRAVNGVYNQIRGTEPRSAFLYEHQLSTIEKWLLDKVTNGTRVQNTLMIGEEKPLEKPVILLPDDRPALDEPISLPDKMIDI